MSFLSLWGYFLLFDRLVFTWKISRLWFWAVLWIVCFPFWDVQVIGCRWCKRGRWKTWARKNWRRSGWVWWGGQNMAGHTFWWSKSWGLDAPRYPRRGNCVTCEAWLLRPLQLTFRAALKGDKEAMASTKIQANWRGKKAKDQMKVSKKSPKPGDLGPELDSFTVVAEMEDLGMKLELWPPAPKILIRSVQRDGWARKAKIQAGDQLLMVQKQPLQSFQDWGKRPQDVINCL